MSRTNRSKPWWMNNKTRALMFETMGENDIRRDKYFNGRDGVISDLHIAKKNSPRGYWTWRTSGNSRKSRSYAKHSVSRINRIAGKDIVKRELAEI